MQNARRARLFALIEAKFHGNRARFQRAVGLSKGRISQLFDEGQPLGELAARRIAERLRLPHDFFEADVPTDVAKLSAESIAWATRYEHASEQERVKFLAAMEIAGIYSPIEFVDETRAAPMDSPDRPPEHGDHQGGSSQFGGLDDGEVATKPTSGRKAGDK